MEVQISLFPQVTITVEEVYSDNEDDGSLVVLISYEDYKDRTKMFALNKDQVDQLIKSVTKCNKYIKNREAKLKKELDNAYENKTT